MQFSKYNTVFFFSYANRLPGVTLPKIVPVTPSGRSDVVPKDLRLSRLWLSGRTLDIYW
jgi:hypothetical protein